MTSEEWDSLTPLPVIPGMKRSVDLTPSAVEQRLPPNEVNKEARDISKSQSKGQKSAVLPKNKMTVKSVMVQKDWRQLENQSKQTRKRLVLQRSLHIQINIFSSGVIFSKSRSVSFPLDPAEKQRIQARILARLLTLMSTISRGKNDCLRKVSEWRRMSKEGMRNDRERPLGEDVSVF